MRHVAIFLDDPDTIYTDTWLRYPTNEGRMLVAPVLSAVNGVGFDLILVQIEMPTDIPAGFERMSEIVGWAQTVLRTCLQPGGKIMICSDLQPDIFARVQHGDPPAAPAGG